MNSTTYLSMRNNKTSMIILSIILTFVVLISMMIVLFVVFIVVVSFVISTTIKNQNIEKKIDFNEKFFVFLEFFVFQSRNVSIINFAHVI